MPDKKGKKFPVVLVVHEIFGVHEWIQDVCRRFAKLGYMAIAPALYARQGDVKTITRSAELQRDIFSENSRYAVDVRSRCDRRMGEEEQRQHEKAFDHGLLLGRAHRLALCGA